MQAFPRTRAWTEAANTAQSDPDQGLSPVRGVDVHIHR
jgi:hypothetical protein